LTIAQRSLCSIIHAVSYLAMPSYRVNCTAEIPGVAVVTRYAAQNHRCNGVWVRCNTIPAVTDTWYPQLTHCHRNRRGSSVATGPPQVDSGNRPASAMRQVLPAGLVVGKPALKLHDRPS
jgi:hypothetical protein